MKSQKTVIIMVLMLLLTMTSIFALSIESATTTNQYSESINYEWGGDFFTFETTDSVLANVPLSSDLSRICDIDKDGKKEIIFYAGNSISIYGFNNAELELEASFTVDSATADNDDINGIACVDPRFDGDDYPNLIIHQGTTSNTSQITFIEYQPDWVGGSEVTVEEQYGNTGYYLNGYYEGVQSMDSGIACNSVTDTWSLASETQPSYECVIANDEEFMVFGLSAFTGGGDNQRFPILNCQTELCNSQFLGAGSIDGLTSGFNRPNIALLHTNALERFIYFRDDGFIKQTEYLGGANWTVPVTVPNFSPDWIYSQFSIGDVEMDGQNEFCVSGTRSVVNLGFIECSDASGTTEFFTRGVPANNGREIDSVTFYDYDLDGDNEIIYSLSVGTTKLSGGGTNNGIDDYSGWGIYGTTAYYGGDRYDATDTVYNTVSRSDFTSFTRFESNLTVFQTGGDWIMMFNKNDSTRSRVQVAGLNPNTEGFFVDLDGDFLSEYLAYDTTTGIIKVHSNSLAGLESGLTIELVDPFSVGDGYFGFYVGSNCESTNTTFKATECIGGQTSDCTYNSTVPSSQERICTDCGGTQPFSCGEFAFANPIFECPLVEGNYSVLLSIESTSKLDIYQALTSPPIPITVVDGVESLTCNTGIFIGSPNDAPTDDNNNGVDDNDPNDPNVPPVGEPQQPPPEPESGFFAFVGDLDPIVKFVIMIALVLGLSIVASNNTNGNPLITSIGAILGLGASVLLGLISVTIVLIGIVVFTIVMFALHKLNQPHFSSGG
jgi:hypothetical protein